MRNSHFQFSIISICSGTVGVLAVMYIGLIAVVMSYAALTVEFSQSVKNDEASVAMLESQYLSNVASIEGLDYRTKGYVVPSTEIFVPASSMTALR
jgi:1-aminocyclopropane-1-carboxylate deaminase/D-cysteine desulfhydrase-like pyridoxal-dependent ACC family enzyme